MELKKKYSKESVRHFDMTLLDLSQKEVILVFNWELEGATLLIQKQLLGLFATWGFLILICFWWNSFV